MELSPYIEQVSQQLSSAAALGDERTREVAGALAMTSRSAVRMAILDALAAASADITEALYQAGDAQPASAVTLHLDGEHVRFQLSLAPIEPDEPARERAEDSDASARISLRLPESVKVEIEQAARQADVSVNSWLVRAATSALRGGTAHPDSRRSSHGRRITGWVTG